MRICIRQERQSTVQQVMAELSTSDPKIAVDWIIADWLKKRDQVPQSQAAAAPVNFNIEEW